MKRVPATQPQGPLLWPPNGTESAPDIYPAWKAIVTTLAVAGKQVHARSLPSFMVAARGYGKKWDDAMHDMQDMRAYHALQTSQPSACMHNNLPRHVAKVPFLKEDGAMAR